MVGFLMIDDFKLVIPRWPLYIIMIWHFKYGILLRLFFLFQMVDENIL
jgi:hypothetical protein